MSRAAEPLPLAVSLGDPAGIGPELIAAAWAQRKELAREGTRAPPFFVVGGLETLRAAAETRGLDCPLIPIAQAHEAGMAFHAGLPVLVGFEVPVTPGTPTSDGAKLALASLKWATKLALMGEASGIVTAPVEKAGLVALGFDFPGQTEFLAAACGMEPHEAVMMLAGPSLRTIPLTVHCALTDVPTLITQDLIQGKTRTVAAALQRDFGIERPRIAVTGLNPHAGEGGQFGREEIDVIAPAIETLRNEGIDATGPHSADALFTPHVRGGYDAAMCMYHDQALIPLKALEFDQGVNVTLGLPIIRTSPDHGTAFDIAGKGIADPSAMIAAIRMAGEMASRRALCQPTHG